MTCRTPEISKGYSLSNPSTAATLIPVNDKDLYSVITVFNETDQHIKVTYKTKIGEAANFIVPKNGRSFTRVINNYLLLGSLHIEALDNAATGTVIINLGN